jgi:hypothetical protein
MTNNVGLTFSVGDTTSQFTISIEQVQAKKRKEKITPVSRYRHESEHVGLVLITVFRDDAT